MLFSLYFLPVTSTGSTEESVNTLNEPDIAEKYINQARKLQLADKIAWLNLLHFKSTFFGGLRSQVDDSEFFLADNGSFNAQAELEADLRGFFSKKRKPHPRCLFPARLHWLNSHLNFSGQLPELECEKYNNWKQKLAAQQVTLLFPSMYLENPASMFGHTFIRFDRPDKNHLLSYTLSYAASYDESDHLLVYSWKGISGGYPGTFFLQAYFETLQEYSDIEQRDIWEYKLNLNKQEIEQLVRHLWEVKGVHFDYFFFRENCSFRLLSLLDVARENINMSIHSHPLYAVPVDTVRDIEKAGLITAKNYRPAAHNKISQMLGQVDELEKQAVSALSRNEISIDSISKEFTEDEQAKIYQITDAILNQNKNKAKDQQSLQLKVLSARSHLAVDKHEFYFAETPPEISHQSARWLLSSGSYRLDENKSQRFYEVGIRPVFHDLLDVNKGFINGASINVLDTQLRWYKEQQKLKLEKLDIFSLKSIVAVNSWSRPLSRKISFQLKQRNLNINHEITEFEFQFAVGYSTNLNNALIYALAQTQFEYAAEFENNHVLYLGFNTGILWSFDNDVISGQTQVDYQLLGQLSGEQADLQKLKAAIQLNIVEDHALRFEYEFRDYELFEVQEAKVSYLIYF
ncbi:MAG: DUF4105 domain-containing protein [Gammaproteobacteria bacterium]|nr:DUF4105 domain-containing protein [Gammaproteobacteria bacterium]